MKWIACLLIVIGSISLKAQELEPGVDRWDVKVSAENADKKPKPISLKRLIVLPLLAEDATPENYPSSLIPEKTGTLKEGLMISTIGYLHLVALEKASDTKRDGDYHIQITKYSEWSDSCFIVEIPYEDFAPNKELKKQYREAREFVREKLLKGKEPGTGGNVMVHKVHVKVTGQLFYDASHANEMRNPNKKKRKYRGKRGKMDAPMKSYTAWEIHPVTKIEFWPEK